MRALCVLALLLAAPCTAIRRFPVFTRAEHEKAHVTLVHVGKCAGATIANTLHAYGISTTEYHMLQVPRDELTRRRVVIAARDPSMRVLSAFNWRHPSNPDLLLNPFDHTADGIERELYHCFSNVSEFAEALRPRQKHTRCEDVAITMVTGAKQHRGEWSMIGDGFRWRFKSRTVKFSLCGVQYQIAAASPAAPQLHQRTSAPQLSQCTVLLSRTGITWRTGVVYWTRKRSAAPRERLISCSRLWRTWKQTCGESSNGCATRATRRAERASDGDVFFPASGTLLPQQWSDLKARSRLRPLNTCRRRPPARNFLRYLEPCVPR